MGARSETLFGAVLCALLAPTVLGFVYRLARGHLPAEARLRGAYALTVAIVFAVTSCAGLYAGVIGAL
jgi:hypothetical protein